MTRRSVPTRSLPNPPDVDHLRRQAKQLLNAYVSGAGDAAAEVNAHFHGADPSTFALDDAQVVIARVYGFESWPKLKAYADGITVTGLTAAVRADDFAAVRQMLAVRPELVHLDLSENDERRALHFAVLQRRPEMVRLLMQHGADARKGIWPHRDATSPLTIATERGYHDIVAIIREEESRRANVVDVPVPAELVDAFQREDEAEMVDLLDAHPGLIHKQDPESGMTALHWAAANLWERLGAWLLDRGADTQARNAAGLTALDLVGCRREGRSPDRSRVVMRFAEMLLRRGAERSERWAIATGNAEWLRGRHGDGGLQGQPGLITHAVRSERPEMVALLLDLGLDADERERVDGLEEVVYQWGAPLRECAIAGQIVMAEMLLQHGASPNTNVYAASSAMYEALARNNLRMVRLLEDHGGIINATAAAYLGLTDRVRQFFEDEWAGHLPDGAVSPGSNIAHAVLEAAADGGHVDLVRMALDHLDWAPGDARWHGMLMRPFGKHGASDRDRYVACFRTIIARSGADLPARFGRTLLHDVTANWPRTSPMGVEERIAFATILLDRGARLDVRDDVLKSTPLGWACRWGRSELVNLFLQRGADGIEADAEPWATPKGWAEKKGHTAILALLEQHGA